jgi:hypothetical protein
MIFETKIIREDGVPVRLRTERTSGGGGLPWERGPWELPLQHVHPEDVISKGFHAAHVWELAGRRAQPRVIEETETGFRFEV